MRRMHSTSILLLQALKLLRSIADMDSEAMTKKSALCTSAIHALSPTGVAQTMGVHFPHRTHPDEPDGGLIAKTRRRRNIGRDIQGKARVILCRCRGHHRVSSALCGDDPSLLRRSGRNIRSTVTWRSTAADTGRER